MDDAIADRVEHELHRAFPELEPVGPLRILGEGFASTALETASGVVFLVARISRMRDVHWKLTALLPELQPRLPTPIPVPRWSLQPSPAVPYGAIGYRKLEGTPIDPTASDPDSPLPADIARFLYALHAFPTDRAKPLLGADAAERWGPLEQMRHEVLAVLASVLTPAEHRTVSSWWDRCVADANLREAPAVLRHGDLWYANMLVDSNRRLAGVLDWAGVRIGDAAEDFAAQLHVGKPFVSAVLREYGRLGGDAGRGLAERIVRYWELREFGGVQYAAAMGDAGELEDSVAKLRAGQILAPDPSLVDELSAVS